jgi:CRP-like cAMP-binding protein
MSTDQVFRNRVLLALRQAAQEFVAQRALHREMRVGEVIYREGEPFTHAVFPHSGLISLMAEMRDGRSMEKISIGSEGFLGLALIMGGGEAISTSIVQVAGTASWLSIRDLDEALEEFVCVREIMLRYAKSLITQSLESIACASMHSAEQRVARWLLGAHDRIEGDTVEITQQAISSVLGLRRATVSEVCSGLQAHGAILSGRGTITIADRSRLEALSCECYEKVRRASLLEKSDNSWVSRITVGQS